MHAFIGLDLANDNGGEKQNIYTKRKAIKCLPVSARGDKTKQVLEQKRIVLDHCLFKGTKQVSNNKVNVYTNEARRKRSAKLFTF